MRHAPQGGERLTQPARRKHRPDRKRIEPIEYDNVHVAVKAGVLKTVIEQKHIRIKLLFYRTPHGIPIRPNAEVGDAIAKNRLCLIAGQSHASLCARG